MEYGICPSCLEGVPPTPPEPGKPVEGCNTPAVLEINNPPETTTFHTVELEGTETEHPMVNGLYRNVIVHLLGNDHKWLYNSDGIPLFLTEKVNDGKLTISVDGVEKTTFTANQSTDSSIDISTAGTLYHELGSHTDGPIDQKVVTDNINNKVDKVSGKGLSTNDYTDADKNKLTDLANIKSVGDGLGLDTAGELTADVKDVQIDGTSIVSSKVANIPFTTSSRLGTVKLKSWNEGNINNDGHGTIYLTPQTATQLSARNAGNGIINASNMDNAVRLALSDGVGTAYTDDEKTAARTRIGAASTDIETKINENVVTNITASSDATNTKLTESKKNLGTSATTTSDVNLPIADDSVSGVITPGTYTAISDSTTKIQALQDGTVVINGLPASPTQTEITEAWKTETGLTTPFSSCKIFDQTNRKAWTYYGNTNTWEPVVADGGTITVNQFTDTSLGTIKGSTIAGRVHAELDGTGSVSGWGDKEDAIATGTTAQYFRGDKSWQTLDKSAVGLGDVDNTSDATKKSNFTGSIAAGNTGFPTGGAVKDALDLKADASSIGDGTLDIKKNGTSVGTFTANQSTGKDIDIKTITAVDTTTAGVKQMVDEDGNNFKPVADVEDGSITTAKLADDAVTNVKIADDAIETDNVKDNAITSDKIDFTTFGFQWSAPIDAGYTPEVESLTGNSVTVGAGTWLLVMKCTANFDSAHPWKNHYISIRQSSVSGTEIAYSHVWSESGGDDMVNLAIGKATVTTNTTFVGTHSASPDSWVQTQNCMMFALRVG